VPTRGCRRIADHEDIVMVWQAQMSVDWRTASMIGFNSSQRAVGEATTPAAHSTVFARRPLAHLS